MSVIHVILSGGVGSRLWPLSRKTRPKQYIPLFGGKSLFQICIERNKNLVDSTTVIGSVDNYLLSRDNLRKIGIKDYTEIIEASPRNTAASIAFSAFQANEDDILFITPSDHVISGEKQYGQAVLEAVHWAEKDFIVTLGAVPTRPETGYGYIERDEQMNVLSFKEKPDLATAEQYIQLGNYLWNSGMFCIKASVYLSELKKTCYEVYETALKAWNKSKNGFLPQEETMLIPPISVDYAVMEHSKLLKVIPFKFDWSDLGSFDALWEYFEKEGREDSDKPNLVIGSEKHVEFIGLENLILVETSDAILVMPRNLSQDVKKVYERLEKENPNLL